MKAHPNLKIDQKLLKMKNTGDETKELKYKTEKQDLENIF